MAQHAPDSVDDATLTRACCSGDLAAFEQLVERYQTMLFTIALRLSGSHDDAADIVQDTFIAAWRKIREFRGDAKISTWLTAIAINHARTRLQQAQQQQRREAYSLDAPMAGGDGEQMPEIPAEGPSALEQMEEAELRQALDRCVESLPVEFREVLILRDMREMPYNDVAEVLQLREGTVKSRLFRARDAIRDCMKRMVGIL